MCRRCFAGLKRIFCCCSNTSDEGAQSRLQQSFLGSSGQSRPGSPGPQRLGAMSPPMTRPSTPADALMKSGDLPGYYSPEEKVEIQETMCINNITNILYRYAVAGEVTEKYAIFEVVTFLRQNKKMAIFQFKCPNQTPHASVSHPVSPVWLRDAGFIAFLKALADLSLCEMKIQDLGFQNEYIEDEGAKAIAEALTKRNIKPLNVLKHLNLSHNVIGGEGALALSSAMIAGIDVDNPQNFHLQDLDLSWNRIPKNVVAQIKQLIGGNPLVSINLDHQFEEMKIHPDHHR